MNIKTQQGNTFYGLLIGIVLAALIIASILWYLNNNKTSFQTYTPPEPIPTTPETIPHINNGQESGIDPAEIILRDFAKDHSTDDQSTVNPSQAEQTTVDTNNTELPTVEPIKTEQTATSPTKHDDIEVLISTIQTPAKTNNEPKNEAIKNADNKVENILSHQTAEQILDGESTKVNQVDNNKFVIQMGSFSTQEQADERKAALSLLNINSSVQQSEKNGQIMYRIRSTTLNQEQANNLQNTLKNQRIDNIIIPLN